MRALAFWFSDQETDEDDQYYKMNDLILQMVRLDREVVDNTERHGDNGADEKLRVIAQVEVFGIEITFQIGWKEQVRQDVEVDRIEDDEQEHRQFPNLN